jgi:integral membrane protein (TIGR01906 family)
MKLLSISILIWVLILPILILANLYPYFYSAFDRYGIYSNFADASSANSKFSEVLDYINFPFNTELDPEFFSTEDILHMQDVRNIFIVVNLVFLITLVSSLILFFIQKPILQKLVQSLSKYVFAFLLLVSLLGIILFFTWNSSFNLFHQVLFPYNNYWQLDPSSSNLIKYLPEQIFQELALLYFIGVSIEFLTLRLFLEKNNA